MGILSSGAQLPTDIVFNSGTLNINGVEVATLQDITVTLAWSQREIRALGTVLMVTAPKRYGFKPSAKGKVKSVNQELYSFFLGSSGVDSTGYAYNVKDGQNVLTRASIKCIVNDDASKHVEFQFTNAILGGSLGLGLKLEDAAELDFEVMAQTLSVVTDFTT